MRIAVPAVFLAAILALVSARLQTMLQRAVARRPGLLFAAPAVLAAVFWALLAYAGALAPWSAALSLLYLFTPAAIAWFRKPVGAGPRVSLLDPLIVLAFWLPLEFPAGFAQWVPKNQQGFVHTAAYGVAILTALWVFVVYVRFEGVKYRPPAARDPLYALAGFAVSAPVLIAVGLWLGFIVPLHAPPGLSVWLVVSRFVLILLATGVPEEILFRGLIQNWLMQKLGPGVHTLLLAAVIFGCAHLNNGSGTLPNWRYAIMAAIAGFAYGKVFERGSSVFASATLHALVNTAKHLFF